MVQETAPEERLLSAAAELQAFCTSQGWRSGIIGGLAVVRWGRPRTTRDVDLSLWTGFVDESPFLDALLGEFEPRIADAREFSLNNRVLLLKARNGTPLDVSLAGIPFEERMLDRATQYDFSPNYSLQTVSAEDLIVLKAFADRPQDWLDIEGVLARGTDLNWAHIEEELRPLCELKEAPEIVDRLKRLRDK